MSKKLKWIIAIAILFAVTVLFITIVFQRQYRDVLMEMIIFPEGSCGDNALVYRFIVQNDGTLITYTGIGRNHCNVARSDIIMWPIIRRRARITLSDEDFQNISEMVSILSENQEILLAVMGQWQITLLIDGNIYDSGLELYKIADELVRLSPLMNYGPLIPPSFLGELFPMSS